MTQSLALNSTQPHHAGFSVLTPPGTLPGSEVRVLLLFFGLIMAAVFLRTDSLADFM
jgi:hypothetical protein